MTRVERVARAICKSRGFDPNDVWDCRLLWWEAFIDDAQAAIDVMQEWQPIESAPKDGTSILLATPSGKIADGLWGNYKVWVWPYVMVEPTHWMERPGMPLPKTPK